MLGSNRAISLRLGFFFWLTLSSKSKSYDTIAALKAPSAPPTPQCRYKTNNGRTAVFLLVFLIFSIEWISIHTKKSSIYHITQKLEKFSIVCYHHHHQHHFENKKMEMLLFILTDENWDLENELKLIFSFSFIAEEFVWLGELMLVMKQTINWIL